MDFIVNNAGVIGIGILSLTLLFFSMLHVVGATNTCKQVCYERGLAYHVKDDGYCICDTRKVAIPVPVEKE